MKVTDIHGHLWRPFDCCEQRQSDYRRLQGWRECDAGHREALFTKTGASVQSYRFPLGAEVALVGAA